MSVFEATYPARRLILAVGLLLAAVPGPVSADHGPGDTPVDAGLRALREGDVPLAVTLLRAGVDGEQKLVSEAWFGLGIAYGKLERWEAAVDAFARGRQTDAGALGPWMLYYESVGLARVGRHAASDSLLVSILAQVPDGPLRERTRMTQLERVKRGGDRVREQGLLRELVAERIGNVAEYAERLARLLEAEEPEEARQYLLLALSAPGSDEARGRAARALLASPEGLPAPASMQAGQVLFALADWRGAERAFRSSLDRGTGDADRDEARYRLGLTLYRARDYQDAMQAFDGVMSRPGLYRSTAAYYHARAEASRSNAADAARALRAFADRNPASRWAPRALRYAGERLSGSDPGAARTMLEHLFDSYPAHWENADALLQLASDAREAGDTQQAEKDYLRLARGVFYPQEKAQGWFWAARLALARGDTSSWAERMDRAGSRYPDTYYGAMALKAVGRDVPVAGPPLDWVASAELRAPGWTGPQVRVAITLLRLGLAPEGSQQLVWALEREHVDRDRMYALWELCVGGGAYTAAVDLGDRLRRGRSLPEDDPRYRSLEFPLYYADLILPEAERRNLDPLLVMALIKQESAFSGGARSYVGARGLMQLMPETAEEWRRRLRIGPGPIGDEELYQPDLNLRLGIPYLAHLVEQFDGSVEKALAAYNGGATNVRRWERRAPDANPETFVESIGYPETRTYVRSILDYYYRYRYLWAQQTGP